ncbi:MAG: hypothetical protein KF865_03245 [Bdellovibrionaceae bacterium]|nr:hypothetical protein [Pseudobdellovibrionaceae bacterium]
MTVNMQPKGRIGLNENWQWVLDGVLLEGRKMLQIKIGGHWILGMLIKAKDGQLFWSSWLDGVSVPVTYYIRARWPKEV